MTEVKIICPHCSQRISAPEEVCGQEVECPTCNEKFLAAAESLESPSTQLDASSFRSGSSNPPPVSRTANEGTGRGEDHESRGRSHSSSEGTKGRGFSISGWQLMLVYFVLRSIFPRLFEDYMDALKFVAPAVAAAGVGFFIWKRIISESYIEGGDPEGIRVKSGNSSLAIALAITVAITISIDLASILKEDGEIGINFFTNEVLLLLIGVVSVFYIALFLVGIHNKNMLGKGIEVSADQIPELHELSLRVSERLQIKPPRIFIVKNDEFSAYTIGFKDSYAVVVNSKVIEEMDQEETAFILGHEFTHIKFRHTLWSTLIGDAGASIPVLSWLLSLPFLKWSRDAEYTCDRGGLVACGSKEAAVSALLLLLGGEKLCRSLSLESIRKQAKELEKGGIFRNPEAFSTHPFTVNRIVKIEACELIA